MVESKTPEEKASFILINHQEDLPSRDNSNYFQAALEQTLENNKQKQQKLS